MLLSPNSEPAPEVKGPTNRYNPSFVSGTCSTGMLLSPDSEAYEVKTRTQGYKNSCSVFGTCSGSLKVGVDTCAFTYENGNAPFGSAVRHSRLSETCMQETAKADPVKHLYVTSCMRSMSFRSAPLRGGVAARLCECPQSRFPTWVARPWRNICKWRRCAKLLDMA